jgi:hypothetical protein
LHLYLINKSEIVTGIKNDEVAVEDIEIVNERQLFIIPPSLVKLGERLLPAFDYL